MKKRILSLLLTLVMVLGMIPAMAMPASAIGLADFYTTIRIGDDVYDVATMGGNVQGDGYVITSTSPVDLVVRLKNYNGGPIYIESSNSLIAGQVVTPKIEVLGECVINVPSGYEGYGIEYFSDYAVPLFTIEFDDLFTDLYGDASLTIQGGGAGAIHMLAKNNTGTTQTLKLTGPVGSKLIINMTEGDGITIRRSVDNEYGGILDFLESDVGVKIRVPDGHYTLKSGNMSGKTSFTNYAAILSVTVNGTSVADGATYTSYNRELTITSTYDTWFYSGSTLDMFWVKEYSRWYLNGEKLNIAAVTPVDNGDSTSSKTINRTLSYGDELEIETWLEVGWPDGTTDIVDRHTVTIIAKTPKFTTQPQGGTVAYNKRHITNWATNFEPVKQEQITYSPTGNVVMTQELNAGASLASLSYLSDGYYYRIRSYYDSYSNTYVESDKVYVTPDQYYTPNFQHGNEDGDIIAGITYVPNGDGTFNANVHVDLEHVDGQMLQYYWVSTGYYWYDHNNKVNYGIGTTDTSRYLFTLYNLGENLEPGKEWKVKVYLADDPYADYEWRDVDFHYVTDTVPELKPEDVFTPAFTTQPVGGEVEPSEKLTVTWATNFTPKKLQVLKYSQGYCTGTQTLDVNATTANVSAGDEYCIVRAYYSDSNYVDSDKFYVTEKVSGSGVTVNCIGEIDYTVSGQTVTVDHDDACAVGYLVDGEYVAVPATDNGDGTYSFTAPEGVSEVVLVIKGDVNGDSNVDKKDYAALKRFCFGTMQLSEIQIFASDVNKDESVDKKDYAALKRACFGTMVIAP